ncbi:MFS transporter [Oxynema aestuarii]|uniref:MFS transporter n=1 Tax=Oxynema aestuarii AP17 TaxID=2064643 RepID=A0A6H1TX83_9CYAN|nr:MFS transporter [Oxynema aestuarii]QIZ70550.1 MFS transporter [Oxynema aestuarii AP17]
MKVNPKWIPIALFSCVFISIFTEVLLSPFYPQFFSKVFGIEDLSYTGYYIFICRLTVVLCAPLWGVFSRWIEVKYLLYCAQIGTAFFTALMATSTSANCFLAYTIGLLLFKSCYLMVYPLIIQLTDSQQHSTVTGTYQAVFHGGIIAATIAGAWMVNLEAPLSLFYAIAIADLFQFLLCFIFLRDTQTRREITPPSEQHSSFGDRWGFIVAIGLIILTFQLANNLIRPFFTAYVTQSETLGITLNESSYLFMIPSAMAIAALPYIRKSFHRDRLHSIYLVGLVLLSVTLFLQGWTISLGILIIARLIYGFCLATSQSALELRLFDRSRGDRLHFNYSLAMSFANLGHLSAPLLASWLVERYTLAMPLFVAAFICAVNFLFAQKTIFRAPIFQPSEVEL